MKKLITALAVLVLLTSCKPPESEIVIETAANTVAVTDEMSTMSATTATEIATTTETIEPAASGGVYIKTKKYPIYVDSQVGVNGAVLGYGNEVRIIENIEDGYTYMETSADCSASLVITPDGDDTLIYYISDEAQEVIEVKGYANCEISGNGKAFVCVSGTKEDESILTLYRDGKAEVLTEKADSGMAFSISPDGSAVSWCEDYNYDDYTFTTMLYLNGETHTLGNSFEVFGLSDNAEYIYYYNDGGIYAQKAFEEENRVKIAPAEYLLGVIYNDDLSQTMIVVSDGSHHDEHSYFYEFGKEPVKISDGDFYPIAPTGYNGATDLKKAFYGSSMSIFDSSVCGLDEDLLPYSVVSDADHFALSPDGTELLYVKDGKLCSIDTSNEDNEETVLFEEVINFGVSEDFENVYFVTMEGELRYLEGKDKSELVTEDYDDFAVSGSDVYYNIGSKVYKGTKGKGELIGEIDNEGRDIYASEIIVYDNNQILLNVFSDEEDVNTYFVSSDGKNFINTDDM